MRPTKFQSSVVVEALQSLEMHLGAHRDHLAHVVSALSAGHWMSALAEADNLRHAIGFVVTMYERLHASIIPADELGSAVESIGELVLRARRMVILSQIGQLRDILRGSAAKNRARSWFGGPFEDIDDVAMFFHNELYRINNIWIQYRTDDAAQRASSDRTTIYRASVRLAQRDLRDLLEFPDLAHFLREGLAMADWPEVHTAFTEITAALAVTIDTVSGRYPIVPPPSSRIAAPVPTGES